MQLNRALGSYKYIGNKEEHLYVEQLLSYTFNSCWYHYTQRLLGQWMPDENQVLEKPLIIGMESFIFKIEAATYN